MKLEPVQSGYTVRYLLYQPQGRLLDVGCGNGQFLRLMNDLGWQTVGIEPDPQAAEAAKTTGLHVMQCGIEDAELEPSGYDAITLYHVLEHLPDPKSVLSKLAYWLKPGGMLISISPNPIGLMASRFQHSWRGLEPPRHFVLPTPKGYRYLLEGLEFEDNIWTTMQTVFWMFRESMSIRQTGHVGSYQG